MKKLFFLILMSPLFVFAKSYLVSSIPLPKTYILNLDPYPCDDACLQKYLKEGFVFSFLAHAESELEDAALQKLRKQYYTLFNVPQISSGEKVRIAMLLPYKKIARYATSTTNASFAYLISKNYPFELKTYKIEDESQKELLSALKKIEQDGFRYVIAPLTKEGEEAVLKLNPQINIFFPTINKKETQSSSPFLYYGGIDYRAQSDLLLSHAASKLVLFYDDSEVAKQLSSYQEAAFRELYQSSAVTKISIPQKTTNLESQLKGNSRISGGSFFINTPIVKSGMVMSQITLHETNAANILSTQTNYNPLLLSMTQYQDRKKMIIANSITQINDNLTEINSFLSNDIEYDWINYTTTIGVDFFSSLISGSTREYSIEMLENQMVYPVVLTKPSVSSFIPFDASEE